MPFTLAAPPGFVDLADAELAAEKFAQGQHLQKIIENYKFGTVRPEFFYMGRFVDGDVVGLPKSNVDQLPYAASEVIYLWSPAITSNPVTGFTGGPGTVLWFEWEVEQFGDNQAGLVHTRTTYHVQGGQTTETTDGKLEVWAVGIRGKGILSMSAVPTWNDQADTEYNLDSVWDTERATRWNGNAKRAIVQSEFFDMGEFGNGQTVGQPVSDVDGFTYPYADVLFLPCWRWTPAFGTGQTSGPAGHTIFRMEASVAAGTGVVTTTVSYRFGGSGSTATGDGRVRVFALCFRAGLTITGTTAFTDVNGANLASGKKMNDKNMVEVNQSIKFAALRPEFFLTTQAHGTTVPLPTSPVDSYAYSRAELIYLAIRQDTSDPGSIGSLLTLHGFVRQDTGVVTLNTFYFTQGGSQTNTNNGTLRVLTIALRSDSAVIDSDVGAPTGGGVGFEGDVDNDLVSGGGILLLRNPGFGSGDQDWTKGTGFTIVNDPTNAYDGDWVAKFVGSSSSVFKNSVTISTSPGVVHLAQCFIKRVSGDGTPRVRIAWLNASKVEIATSNGNLITSTTYELSRVVAAAPAGTFFARVECTAGLPTVSQTAYYDQFFTVFFPTDLDDVADSTTKFAAVEAGADKTATRLDNVIINSGFELGTKEGWDGAGSGTVQSVGADAHRGSQVMQVASAAGGPNQFSLRMPIGGSERVLLSIWARRKPTDLPDADTFLRLRSWNAAGGQLDSINIATADKDTSGWQFLRGVVTVNTAAVEFILDMGESAGTTGFWWFDDAVVSYLPKDVDIDVLLTTNAPVDAGATLGSDWAVDLSNRPVELTDGRIIVGIDSSGNLIFKNIDNVVGTTSSPFAPAVFAVLPEMTKTITTKGNDVLVLFNCAIQKATGVSQTLFWQLQQDGVDVGKEMRWSSVAVELQTITLKHVIAAPSAASHTYRVRWKASATLAYSAHLTLREIQVVELG